MQLIQPFQVGDRVRMARKVSRIAKGTPGTIIRVLPHTDCYDVQFEQYPWPRLVYCGDLEYLARERGVGSTQLHQYNAPSHSSGMLVARSLLP